MERGFIGLDIAVLAVSEAGSIKDEAPAQLVLERLGVAGHRIVAQELVEDSVKAIRARYLEWIGNPEIDAVIVTSGFKTESASEALAPLITKPVPGFADLFRWLTFEEIGTAAMLVEAAAGQCKATFIFVLPASIGATRTALDKLLMPQLDYRTKPHNLVMRMPRHHQTGEAGGAENPSVKTPWIVPKNPNAPAPLPKVQRAGTEPGTPVAIASAGTTAKLQTVASKPPAQVAPVPSVPTVSLADLAAEADAEDAIKAAPAPKPSIPLTPSTGVPVAVAVPAPSRPSQSFSAKEITNVTTPPPPPPPRATHPPRTKTPTNSGVVPPKPPAQIIPLSQLLTNEPGAVRSRPISAEIEELPDAEVKEVAQATIVDDDDADTDVAAAITSRPARPLIIEELSTREAIERAQKRAVTERVAALTDPSETGGRTIVIPARRKTNTKLAIVWSIIALASAALIVMFVIIRARERRAAAASNPDPNDRIAVVEPPPPTGISDPPVTEPATPPAEPTAPTEPREIDMESSPTEPAPPATPPVNTPPKNPPTTIGDTAPRPPRVPKTPKAPKEPELQPVSVENGCDEVSCVLDRYRLPCCAPFKPAQPVAPPPMKTSGLPEKLDRQMVSAGMANVKPAVIACGEASGVHGTVKLTVKVSPAGKVTDIMIASTPDPPLAQCVSAAVRKATFEPTENGGSFGYPFVF